jgi:hypothetical protein
VTLPRRTKRKLAEDDSTTQSENVFYLQLHVVEVVRRENDSFWEKERDKAKKSLSTRLSTCSKDQGVQDADGQIVRRRRSRRALSAGRVNRLGHIKATDRDRVARHGRILFLFFQSSLIVTEPTEKIFSEALLTK